MTDGAAQKNLEAVFRQFEQGLQEHLAQEAQRSVDGAIERLSMELGPFRISGVEVEVVIRKLTVESGDQLRPEHSQRRRATKVGRRRSSPAAAGGYWPRATARSCSVGAASDVR